MDALIADRRDALRRAFADAGLEVLGVDRMSRMVDPERNPYAASAFAGLDETGELVGVKYRRTGSVAEPVIIGISAGSLRVEEGAAAFWAQGAKEGLERIERKKRPKSA